MACEICEHCNHPVSQYERTICQGYSYHKECCKCYICSETNLHGAEVFKGAIFCAACSQRIFRGCVTARNTKTLKRKPFNRRRGSPRRRQTNRPRILEMTQLSASYTDSQPSKDSDSSSCHRHYHRSQSTLQTQIIKKSTDATDIKTNSVEMGMTTEITQQLIQQMNRADTVSKLVSPKPEKKLKEKRIKHDNECSDLRIAELGASTEIAYMALMGQSEVPVIIKSRSYENQEETYSQSKTSTPPVEFQDETLGSTSGKWLDSNSPSEISAVPLLDRRIGSILKLPYKFFRRNILDRSSLISVLMSDNSKKCFLRRIKDSFHEEIQEHHKRGLRKLYPTINRKKIPYKLGWLNVTRKEATADRVCKHLKGSHSYRCMRSHIMRLAGPTSSELALIRENMKHHLFTGCLKNIFNFNKQFQYLMSSEVSTNRDKYTK